MIIYITLGEEYSSLSNIPCVKVNAENTTHFTYIGCN